MPRCLEKSNINKYPYFGIYLGCTLTYCILYKTNIKLTIVDSAIYTGV